MFIHFCLCVYSVIKPRRRFLGSLLTEAIFLVIASNIINVTLVIASESCTDGEYDQALWEKLSEKVNNLHNLTHT